MMTGKRVRYLIKGFRLEEDYPCYEQEIKIALDDLKKLMDWKHEWMVANDHRLDDKQITRIEQACSVKIPAGLEVFLMTRV